MDGNRPTSYSSRKFFPQNHHPIFLLSSVGKIAERVIRKRLAEIVNDILGILPDEQFGFRPHHSTSDQLLRVVEFATKSIEWKQFTSIVFLDVAKAFGISWQDKTKYLGVFIDRKLSFIDQWNQRRPGAPNRQRSKMSIKNKLLLY